MKKIFAIALAVVMVLSIASVAGALWEPAPADPASEFRVQVSVEKYALETGTYGYKYTAADTITAANGADVYYVVKLVIPSNPNAEEKAAIVKVNYDGIQGTNYSSNTVGDIINGNFGKTGTYYYNGSKWIPADQFVTNPSDVVVQARCFDTSVASIDVEASSQRELGALSTFKWKGYNITYKENDVISFEKNGKYVKFNLGTDGLASFREGSEVDSTFQFTLFNDLGFTYEELNAGKVYMNKTNLRNVFGYSYKVTDSVNWTATNYPIIVDTNVGIPKTGDNASVIGFAMIMVAVVAAAVAVRKVNA